MKDIFEVIWKLLILWTLLWIASSLDAYAADLPKHVNLTFTNVVDLDRQTDSVLAVCHTDSMLVGYEWNPPTDESREVYYHFQVCRRFTGLTVFVMPDSIETELLPGGGSLWHVYVGKARIWWWEERRD